MKKLIYFLSIFISIACSFNKDKLIDRDIELWKNTKGWDLAKAVYSNDSIKIHKVLENSKLSIDYKDPIYGQSLLTWGVLNNRIKTVRILLNYGADPNLHNTYNGSSPITESSSTYVSDIEILKLLLDHGGNPNDIVLDDEILTDKPTPNTPLIKAATCSIEKVKLLIKYGADINLTRIEKRNEAFFSFHLSPLGSAVKFKKIDIAKYLLIERKADFKKVYSTTINSDTINFAGSLRYWTFPLESDEHKEKMIIVEYLLKNGQDYWKTSIPELITKKYDSLYLSKY